MKKFQFTLGKLLDYKGQILDKEKNDLAALNAQKAETVEQIYKLNQAVKQAQDEFNQKAQKGISPMEMTLFTGYHKSLRLRIEEAEKSLKKLELDIEKQTGVVAEASKDVKSLEKLEEKQLEDYNFRVQKSEEQFIEEYVNGASVRASLAENAP